MRGLDWLSCWSAAATPISPAVASVIAVAATAGRTQPVIRRPISSSAIGTAAQKYRTSKMNGFFWPSTNSATIGTSAQATSRRVERDRPRPSRASEPRIPSGQSAAIRVIVASEW